MGESMKTSKLISFTAIIACAGWLSTSQWAWGALDTYDLAPNGTNLLGTTNGQIHYVDASSFNSPIGGSGGHFIATNTDSTSPPNSAEMADANVGSGGLQALLETLSAVNIAAPGSKAVISFDFKTTSGPTDRVNLACHALYSVD